MPVDVAQVRDVGLGIIELVLAERPARPVGEAVRLVEHDAGDARDQLVVGNRIAEAAHHGGHLRVENRIGHEAAEVPDDLDVLPGGVEHLEHGRIAHQGEKRRQIEAGSERVDQKDLFGTGELHDAQLRPERTFAQEFRVDGDEGEARQMVAGFGEGGGRCNHWHG